MTQNTYESLANVLFDEKLTKN